MDKINETLNKMDKTIADISTYSHKKIRKLDPETREKADALISKTVAVINEAKEKVIAVSNSVQDEERLADFLTKVELKCEQAAEYTKAKVDELLPKEPGLEEIEQEVSAVFDRFLSNDNIKSAVRSATSLSDSVVSYLHSDDARKKINKAKKATLNAAEKGMVYLRKVLAVEEEEDNEILLLQEDSDYIRIEDDED